jgi:hypothetical protein
MSRCKEIFAGDSTFATVASKIAGNPLERPQDHLSTREIRQLLRGSSPAAAISDRQRAFALWHAIYLYRRLFDSSTMDQFLDRAIELDPDNVLYRLVKIRGRLLDGHKDWAREALHGLAESEENRSGLIFFLTKRIRSQKWLPRAVVESFRELAHEGHPGALLCLALAAVDPAEARAAAVRFLRLRPASLAAYDEDVRRVLPASRGLRLPGHGRRMLAS